MAIVLFVLPVCMQEIFYKLGDGDEIISSIWLIALIVLVIGFSIKPFRKSEEKLEKKDNKIANILSGVALVLFIISVIFFFLQEEFIVMSIVTYGVALILTICVRKKYPNNIFLDIVLKIAIILIILFIAFFTYFMIAMSHTF